MSGITRFNRREILAGVSGFGSIGLAGCTGRNSAGDGQTDAPDTQTENSPEVGKYGLPHCESGKYAFEILEIESESATEYANIVAKNLTTENIEIFSLTVLHNGNEYFVEVPFDPRETKTVPLEGDADFAPDSDFRLDVNGLDEEYDGMKCSTGSPSEEYEMNDDSADGGYSDENDNRDIVEDSMNEADSQDRSSDSRNTENPTTESTTTSEPEIVVEAKRVYSYGSTDIQVDYELRNQFEAEKPVEIELQVATSADRTETSTQNYTVSSGGETSISVEFENPDLDTIYENGNYPLSVELYKNGELASTASCNTRRCESATFKPA